MSNPNNSKGWLSSKFWPVSAAHSKNFTADLQQSTITAKSLAGGSFSTRPVDIKSISLEAIAQVKDCSYNQTNTFSLRKLERLDSVGGSDSEPVRFSYPPCRTLDKSNLSDHMMGNQLQKMWLSDGLSKINGIDIQSSNIVTPEKTGPTSNIARVGSYLRSSLQNLTSKFNSNFSYISTAGSANRVDHFSTSMLGEQTTHDFVPDKTEKPVGAFPIPHMAQITVSCDGRGCLCQNMQVMSCIQATLPNSDCTEVTLMSPECFKEMQMTSAIKDFLPQDCVNSQSDQVSDVTPKSNNFSADANNSEIQCDRKPIGPMPCKNPYIANILGFEHDNDSDCSFESTPLENNTDECCYSSSCEESSDSDDEQSVSSGCDNYPETCQFSDTDDNLSDDDMSSTDDNSSSDDELCPWQQVLSSRISWTARRKRRSNLHRHSTKTDIKSMSGDDSDKPIHAVSEIDSGGFQFESSVSNMKTKNTVQRPTCTNSNISYILGDSKDGDESDCGVNNLSCSDSENCWSVEENTSSAPECDSQISLKAPSDSCELWNYFVKCQSAFMDICSTEVNKPMQCSSSFSSSRKEHKATALTCNQASGNKEDIISMKKSPTKVRFDDNVVVHRMVTWSFAYRQARKGSWDAFSRDQVRFRKRISNIEKDIAWCFVPEHREKVFKLSVSMRG